MADEFLIRAYDVGLGDCIFCRIPGGRKTGAGIDDFHILIDCGSWSGMPYLQAAMKRLAEDCKGRLDLVVVTHEHKDHIAGFDAALFEGISIGAIWMNCAMNPNHPQAKKSLALQGVATQAMRGLAAQGFALTPEIQDLVGLFGIDNDGAMTTLRTTLPKKNGIKPTYVFAGQSGSKLGLPLADGTEILVVGPEQDIDHFYLGKAVDRTLRGMMGAMGAAGAAEGAGPADAAAAPPAEHPSNISAADFRQLRSRMLSSALAFAELSSKVTNNTSVVLLITWRGKRLLFVGDAEWDTAFKDGKSNGAWNTMWNKQSDLLDGPIDFLKIGHHGSENATPWNDQQDGAQTEPAAILDAILPLPKAGAKPKARAVVSTERSKYKTIPRCALLVELGKRVSGTKNYSQAFESKGLQISSIAKFDEFEKAFIDADQPLRTDLERLLGSPGYVDVTISAAG